MAAQAPSPPKQTVIMGGRLSDKGSRRSSASRTHTSQVDRKSTIAPCSAISWLETRAGCRQTLPWDYFPLARHAGPIARTVLGRYVRPEIRSATQLADRALNVVQLLDFRFMPRLRTTRPQRTSVGEIPCRHQSAAGTVPFKGRPYSST